MARPVCGWIMAAAMAAGSWSASAAAGQGDADAVVARTHVAGGLCAFPRARAGDAELILELARRPAMVVHVTAADEKLAADLRRTAEAAGLLGRSLYVEQGDAGRLPFADRLVDLVVVSDLADGDLTAALRGEWLRVLAPRRGAALVGRAKALGDGLSPDKLAAWTKDLPLARVVRDDSGTWAVLRADLPAGSDPWTHRCHAADNVQVSQDATFKPPFLFQWWSLPRQEGYWGTSLVSGNGRMFTVRAGRRPHEPIMLTARSLANGLVLWQQRLHATDELDKVPHDGYVPGRSCVAVAGDTLCLIDRDGVALLDAETGRRRDRIAGPKPDGQVKWMAVSAGRLAMLSGEADTIQVLTYQTVAANPVGRELAVYDLSTGKPLWHDTVGGDVDERCLAVRDGRLAYLARDEGVFCRELATGEQVWKNEDPAILADFRTPDQRAIRDLLVSQPALLVLEEAVLLRVAWAKKMFALSKQDGRTLWSRPSNRSERAITAVPLGGLWLGDGLCIDLKTGEPAKGTNFRRTGCGPTTAAPGLLITCFGAIEDTKTGGVLRPTDVKVPCDAGSIVSEGVMVNVPSQCACPYEFKSYRALVSAGSFRPHAAPTADPGRLTTYDAAEPAAAATAAADWPTYRHDPQRSAASPAVVGEGVRVLWRWTPAGAVPYKDTWDPARGPRLAPDWLATAPVAAGGRAWFVSHDGIVRCLAADSGRQIWQFPTGAMCFAPPTVWQGRVLVGGGDGRVYCLDAAEGRLLWRLQVGPCRRRVVWLGHLISTWPVLGGVVVVDGVGCAVAGHAAEDGIHAYAFDPRTGRIAWEKHDAGSAWMASSGGAAVLDGRLYVAGAAGGSFDVKTGEWKVSPDRFQGKNGWKPVPGHGFGSEIGAVCNRWVLCGVRRLGELQSDIGSPINSNREPTLGVPGATSLPAWDGTLTVFGPLNAAGSLLAARTEKLIASAGEDGRPPDVNKSRLWTSEPGTPAAFALAADVVVAAFADPQAGHTLAAFKRGDGSTAWSLELPEQPAMNRLAIDRDGRVIVGLCDGSVICVGK